MEYIKDTTTFIIPTLGRYSLHRALDSLKNQTSDLWKAIVVFDNHRVTIPTDEKISAYTYNKPAGHGAGTVRNFAIPLVDTEFIGFLDDDDWLDKNYVKRLQYYANDYDLISFSYKDVTNGNIQPPKHLNEIRRCNIGISFAVRTSIVQNNNIRFIPQSIEDYQFISDCVNAGAKPIITHEILYFVNGRGQWVV